MEWLECGLLIFIGVEMLFLHLPGAGDQAKVLTRVCVESKSTSDSGVTLFLTAGVPVPIRSETCIRWVPEVRSDQP